mgnify:CR=1 FL=1
MSKGIGIDLGRQDAVGVRLTSLPITAEAVYRALRAKRGEPLEAQ